MQSSDPSTSFKLGKDWPAWVWTLWSLTAAFGTYFCMYAFRKPFNAAGFDVSSSFKDEYWGLDEKSLLVIAQVLGYTASKFLAIKFVAELRPERRAAAILVLIALAEAALLLFGIAPVPLRGVCLFFNGLPLGMVFGLVLGFLEGRRVTEALTAGLCVSFILADGFMKSVGEFLLQQGVSQYWMPAAAGGMFVIPLCIGVAMLSCIPHPTQQDEAERSERTPLNHRERMAFLREYGLVLIPIIVVYLLATILRSFRGDFLPELWSDLGTKPDSGTYTQSEMVVSFFITVFCGATVIIHDNRRALLSALGICGLGAVLLCGTVLWHKLYPIPPMTLIVLLGTALYLPYVAIHTTVLERLIALSHERGNLGFLMSMVDAVGYLGYVGVLLVRKTLDIQGNLLDFFLQASLIAGLIACGCVAASVLYFLFFYSRRILPVKPAAPFS